MLKREKLHKMYMMLWRLALKPSTVSSFSFRTEVFREEGIMLKNPLSKWVPDERKFNWVKMKPEYLDVPSALSSPFSFAHEFRVSVMSSICS